ncbi:MAG: CoA pyrophosphatase [Chloroflexi bacterium]|nr:CoA pyrophosphatase [Chloroflexota bacterium]
MSATRRARGANERKPPPSPHLLTPKPRLPTPGPRPPIREAAVLLIFYEVDGEPHLVLTKRTESVAEHKGEISLPGGARDAEDLSLLETALREAAEELGIISADVEVLGELPSVNTRVTNYEVAPFVGWTARRPFFRPRSDEVAEVIELPLGVLLRPDAVEGELRDLHGSRSWVEFLRYGEHRIWGATFRILQQLMERLAAGEYSRLRGRTGCQ